MMAKAFGIDRPFLSMHNHRTETECLEKMIVVIRTVLIPPLSSDFILIDGSHEADRAKDHGWQDATQVSRCESGAQVNANR
jgi:hypothetical protein